MVIIGMVSVVPSALRNFSITLRPLSYAVWTVAAIASISLNAKKTFANILPSGRVVPAGGVKLFPAAVAIPRHSTPTSAACESADFLVLPIDTKDTSINANGIPASSGSLPSAALSFCSAHFHSPMNNKWCILVCCLKSCFDEFKELID